MSTENEEVQEKPQVWFKTGEPGLYLHIPTGQYYSRYRLNGKRTFISLKTETYTVAKLRHKEKLMAVEEQRQVGKPTTEMRTLGDLLNRERKAVEDATLGESTKRHYGMRFTQLEACWPKGSIHKFVPARVSDELLVSLRNNLAKKLAPASVNQTLHSLKCLLDEAIRLHLAVYNPLADPTTRDRILMKVSTRKPDLPSKDILMKVFSLLGEAEHREHLEPGFMDLLRRQALNAQEHAQFLAFTGMRLEEGNSARWEDIVGDRIHVTGGVGDDAKLKTKTSDRWVPIVPAMAELLKKMKARRAEAGIPVTGPILLCQGSKIPMAKVCEKLGVTPLRHHDLRHFFATICIESGVDIPTVSRWLGHADGGTLAMKTYGHLRDEHSALSAAKVSFANTAQSIPA